MDYRGGYITNVDELYVFARSVGEFCDEFRDGCDSAAAATDGDLVLGRNQIERLERKVDECKWDLEAAQREYDEYVMQEDYDSGVASSLRERIAVAREKLEQAQRDLATGRQLFLELRNALDEINRVATSSARCVEDLGDRAVMAIRRAADIIANEYNT